MDAEKKDIISIGDFSAAEILHVLDVAAAMERQEQSALLAGRIIGTAFFEPSTRTQFSFMAASNRLGATTLGFTSDMNISQQKGELLSDTIKMIDGYVDALVIRHSLDGAARYVADLVDTPVINGGDGANQHPSQTFLDLYTIRKHYGNFDKRVIAFVGDLRYGRTVHSLALALCHFDVEFHFVSPDNLRIPKELTHYITERGLSYYEHDTCDAVLPLCDVIYMTRFQRERFPDDDEFKYVTNNYVLHKDMLDQHAKDNLIVLHPLPRLKEIDTSVDNSKYAMYFQQARNGIPVRKALLALCLRAVPRLGG